MPNSTPATARALSDPELARLRAGDRRLLARVISGLENADASALATLDRLATHIGRAWRVGITGPPGAGKSTLIGESISILRDAGKTVAVLAVDPSSPFTGGALLGDRVRMPIRVGDSGVFIRSVATRGALGGLAAAADDIADLLDAVGFDIVILETVGVGQSEVAVASSADSVVVVLHPESGDGIQALKAGLMEIAHVIAINKADRPGADGLQKEIEHALMLSNRWPLKGHDPAPGVWPVPIVQTAAAAGAKGVAELWQAIEAHRAWRLAQAHWPSTRRQRLEARVRGLADREWQQRLHRHPAFLAAMAAAVAQVEAGSASPAEAAAQVVSAVVGSAVPERRA